MTITKEEFLSIRNYIYQICGIYLPDEKTYLVQQRLDPLLTELKLHTFADIISAAKRDAHINERMINAITTNETLFFRDQHPYQTLQSHILPIFFPTQASPSLRKIRVWSAACSTGQEPYSIAMIALEFFNQRLMLQPKQHIEIVASDISSNVLNKAKDGHYPEWDTKRGLNGHYLARYFEKKCQWRLACAQQSERTGAF